MDNPTFQLLCARGGEMTITFKTHYINIHNELKDTVENMIIPYSSVCCVEEEHLKDGQVHLRRIHIMLTSGKIKTLESNRIDDAEQILLNLLRNTLHPRN